VAESDMSICEKGWESNMLILINSLKSRIVRCQF
jgi:hypothetical protein